MPTQCESAAIAQVEKVTGQEQSEISLEHRFVEDLEFDSDDFRLLLSNIRLDYQLIPNNEVEKGWITVQDLAKYLETGI